jgi:AbrB family looped-hinge helix DNA binding protein
MNIGVFTKPNEKGQIVIPKEMRDELGITSDVTLNLSVSGKGIYIALVDAFISKQDREESYVKLLEKTQGGWGSDTTKDLEQEQQRRAVELKASEERNKAWY